MDTFIYIGIWYAAIVGALYFLQGYMIFAPYASAPPSLEQSRLHDVAQPLKLTDDTGLQTTSWIIPPKDPNKPILIYFHGNGIHALHGHDRAFYFAKGGYGFVLAEYPGYGGNDGTPTEKSLYATARALINKVKTQYPQHEIILYGESIGSGVATQMATEFKPKALILEAPFTSVTEVAQRKFFFAPVFLLLRHRFDNMSKIKDINAPLLIIHGMKDNIIHSRYGQKLYEAANEPKQFRSIENAGHNDLLWHHTPQIALQFINELETN